MQLYTSQDRHSISNMHVRLNKYCVDKTTPKPITNFIERHTATRDSDSRPSRFRDFVEKPLENSQFGNHTLRIGKLANLKCIFSKCELTLTFAICCRPSVCRLSVVCLSVTFVHTTQAIEIFGNVSTPFYTVAIC